MNHSMGNGNSGWGLDENTQRRYGKRIEERWREDDMKGSDCE